MPSPGASGSVMSPFASGVMWSRVISQASDFSSTGYSQIDRAGCPAYGCSEALRARWDVKVWLT